MRATTKAVIDAQKIVAIWNARQAGGTHHHSFKLGTPAAIAAPIVRKNHSALFKDASVAYDGIKEVAARDMTTNSEYVHQAVIRNPRVDGIDTRQRVEASTKSR
jgi:hypothetical protein